MIYKNSSENLYSFTRPIIVFLKFMALSDLLAVFAESNFFEETEDLKASKLQKFKTFKFIKLQKS